MSGFLGRGYGIASLFDGQTVCGFNFTYECPVQYTPSVGNQAYAAKWKKPEKSLELLGSPTGNSGKIDACEFTVTLHDFVYDMQNGTIATFSPEQYQIRMGMALPLTSPPKCFSGDGISHVFRPSEQRQKLWRQCNKTVDERTDRASRAFQRLDS